MTYQGIDNCEHCGKPLEERRWMHGVCEACEQAKKKPKRPVKILESNKRLI